MRPQRATTYQLVIHLDADRELTVGRLGSHAFPAGWYRYTGSAQRGLIARLRRHTHDAKRLRWHIDYLLADPAAQVVFVRWSRAGECRLNSRGRGRIVCPGFGASDCHARCGAHLRYFGARFPPLG